MKTLAPFTQDGFKASIELLRFQRDMHNDLIQAVTSIIGTSPTFIKGGEITQAGGNTTITNGIVCYNEKLYTFTGGTYAGTPSTLKVKFEEATAAGYPQPYLVGDPVPKDIYIARTAKVDAGGSIFLSAVSEIRSLSILNTALQTVENDYFHFTESPQPATMLISNIGGVLYRKSNVGLQINLFLNTNTKNIAANSDICRLINYTYSATYFVGMAYNNFNDFKKLEFMVYHDSSNNCNVLRLLTAWNMSDNANNCGGVFMI